MRTAKGSESSASGIAEIRLEICAGVGHQTLMQFEIDWEFIRDFHPLPNSDRRRLLKEMGLLEISHRDDDQFYGWLAERYRAGDGPAVDAAIHRSLKKPEERGLDAVLCEWLLKRTNRRVRRIANQRSAIRSMASDVLDKGGERAATLRALARNYPWLELDPLDMDDATISVVPDADAGLAVELPLEGSPVQAPAVEGIAGEAMTEDPAGVLDRLAGAIATLRELPAPGLIMRAASLADAIEAHAAEARAAQEGEARRLARASLESHLTALDPELAAGIQMPDLEQLGMADIERIVTALQVLDEAHRDFAEARDAARSAVIAPKAERDLANARLDHAEQARDQAVTRLSSDIELIGAEAETESERSPAAPSMPAPKAQPARSGPEQATPTDAGGEVSTDALEPAELSEEASVAISPAPPAMEALDDAHEAMGPQEEMLTPHPLVAAFPAATAGGDTMTGSRGAGLIDGAPSEEFEAWDAADAQSPAGKEQFNQWDGWVTTALTQRRYALAMHLADGQRWAGARLEGSIPADVVEGLLHGSHAQAAFGRTWTAYEQLRGSLLKAARRNWPAKLQTDLLLFAGAIRPALVQSEAALTVINELEGDVAARLKPLKNAIELVARLRVSKLGELAPSSDQEEKRQRAKELKAELIEWGDKAPARKMNYQPATLVWQGLVAHDGLIGRALSLALGGKTQVVNDVRSLVRELEDDPDKVIDDAHLETSKGIRRDPIVGMARKHLIGQIANATQLLSRWAENQDDLGPREDRFQAGRERLLPSIAGARETVSEMTGGQPEHEVASAVLDAVLADLEAQLRGGGSTWEYSDAALDWEIALLPRFPLNARLGLRVEADDVEDLAIAAEAAIVATVPSPDDAFAKALDIGAISSARRLLPHLSDARRETAEAAISSATDRSAAELTKRKRRLRQLLDDLQIATTAGSSELDELERAMTSFEQITIGELPHDIGERLSIADFPMAGRELDRIERLLDKVRMPLRASLEARISTLEGKFGTALDDCRQQLERGDLGTLSEEVDQIEKHGLAGLPEGAPLSLFRRFTEILTELGEKPAIQHGNLPRIARDGGTSGPFDFSGLTPLDRERGETLLESWNAMRRVFHNRSRKGSPEHRLREAVRDVFHALGWTDVQVEECRREGNWYRMSVSTVALRSRDACPVPEFGSELVRGNDVRAEYALIVAGPDDKDACISSLDRLPHPALLFVTDALNHRQRRDILRKTRKGAYSLAVADAVTITLLAATPDASTRKFFELAIPMGGAQPYADKGSETAIENFFGRERELNTLLDPRGASFVYGGRQLGKTALLKQIELRQRDNVDRVAVYCFIKDLGDSQGVWEEIHAKLTLRGLTLTKGGSVADQLKAWVNEEPGRFLLIMLDEADAFLESEMTAGFPTIEQMKTLMADTQRRLKFVYAGLHNVQRFYRAPNSPLLHLGVSVNVGPLLGSDRRAARQMALEPMAALGLAFEDKIDAYHMLSLIGFYPSLMQSFGKAVVTAVNEKIGRTGEPELMPLLIDRETIDACFNEQVFRQGVLDRFQDTLQLDERYELITYAVWNRMQEDSHAGRSTAFGYSAADISKVARNLWPAGFAETESLESFTAILDEMEEMGVLARRGDRYTLRSQRIAAMLGGKTEIDNRLLAFIDRQPRRRADPMTSHRRIAQRWSPLTLRQEGSIQKRLTDTAGPRIILIGATPASGLHHLRDAIEAFVTSPAHNWPRPRQLKASSVSRITEVAATVRRDAHAGKRGLVVVEGEWPTPDELLQMRRDRALRESARPVRLILCGIPTAEVLAMPEVPELMKVLVGPLTPETLVHWMIREQFSFADDARVLRDLREASGGWLDALDSIQLTSSQRRGGSDKLISAASAFADKLTLDDLGIRGDMAGFARELFKVAGGAPVSESDLRDWASMVDEASASEKVALLEALGIIETLTMGAQSGMRAFNPVAARLLA